MKLRRFAGLALASAGLVVPTGLAFASAPPPGSPLLTIATAASQSVTTPSRFEMFVDVKGLSAELDGDRPMLSGALSGNSFEVSYDLALSFAAIGIDVSPGVDTSATMRFADNALFVKAPLLAEASAALGPDFAPLDALGAAGDGWARIDLGDAADASAPPTEADLVSDVVESLTSSVEAVTEIGTETIRGAEATGYRIDVSLNDATVDTAEAVSVVEPGVVDSTAVVEAAEMTSDIPTLPVEVWIGSTGYVVRVVVPISADLLGGLSADSVAVGEPGGPSTPSISAPPVPASSGPSSSDAADDALAVELRIENFDYGAADIDLSAPTDFVDITEAVNAEEMLGSLVETAPVPLGLSNDEEPVEATVDTVAEY